MKRGRSRGICFCCRVQFVLEDSLAVEFRQPGIYCLDRDNVAIMVRLSAKKTREKLVVANTHLLYNPKRQDVKLAQSVVLLAGD